MTSGRGGADARRGSLVAICLTLGVGVWMSPLVGDGAAAARSTWAVGMQSSPSDTTEAVTAFLDEVEQAARAGEDLSTFEARLYALRQDRSWLERRWVDYAEAWLRHRQGREEASISLLEPLVGAQHHTVPIDPRFHVALAQAYTALDRPAAAQGQWRLALASVDEAAISVDEAWLRAALAAAVAAGPETLVPDSGPSAGVQLINLGSIVREQAAADYQAAFFEPRDHSDGTAYWVSRYALNCITFEATILDRRYFAADGRRLREERSNRSFKPNNVLADHVAEMVCSTPLEGLERAPAINYQAQFQAYRALLAKADT